MKTIKIKNVQRSIEPKLCGQEAPTLVIGSIGVSAEDDPLEVELNKALLAQRLGVDAVTDHSFYGNLDEFHRPGQAQEKLMPNMLLR